MIISVEKAKSLMEFKGWTDERIEMKLKAIEQTIRSYTNNNFQDRGFRVTANVSGSTFTSETLVPFVVGDTIQVSASQYNNGLYEIVSVNDNTFEVSEPCNEENGVLVTKVVYPADVVDCALNLLDWEVNNRSKVGIQSETLSRHSVTYFNQDSGNQVMGYPVSLMGGLKPYRKARC